MSGIIGRWARFAPVFLLGTILAACQAPLDLTKVDVERTKPVQRFDTLQAVVNNGEVVVAVGSYGTILTSKDSGETWARNNLSGNASLIDVAVCPDKTFVALDYEGNLYFGDADGTKWEPKDLGAKEVYTAIACDAKSRIWLVGSFGSIVVSANRGATWQNRSTGEDLIFRQVKFVDSRVGFVFGEFGKVMVTANGGESFTELPVLPNEFYPLSAYFKNAAEGWVGGLGGVVMHTTNGGQTWEKQQAPTTSPIYAMAMHADALYASGNQGVLLKYNGNGWGNQTYPNRTFAFLGGLVSLNDKTMIAVGGSGSVVRLAL